MTELVQLDRDDPMATVTLSQPARLNAVSNAMWDRLGELFGQLGARSLAALHRADRRR